MVDTVRVAATLDLARRPRRLRRSAAMRDLVRETRLSPANLIYPLFVCEGEGVRREVPSMPGVHQLSVDEAVAEAAAAAADGLRGVLLFGLPAAKDAVGTAADDDAAPVQAAVRAIKRAIPNLLVTTDVCLCEYTSHGHCGILEGETIVNDATVERLASVAVSHARAGADIVMVKPAIHYLDVITRVKASFNVPLAAYHVSGEYALLKAAARNGWIDEPRAMMETLTAIRRAGADILITYYAREAARALA